LRRIKVVHDILHPLADLLLEFASVGDRAGASILENGNPIDVDFK
jgi:hypothetical protein